MNVLGMRLEHLSIVKKYRRDRILYTVSVSDWIGQNGGGSSDVRKLIRSLGVMGRLRLTGRMAVRRRPLMTR